ncbi:hypothetical protein TcYC6_0086170 [Trypanosoma cruzi]|nr:hypothetical protein TcYC6_0086170 [Trypanosoma cruzi]
MGQRGIFSSGSSSKRNPKGTKSRGCTQSPWMDRVLPTVPSDMEPTPLLAVEAAAARNSWLSTTESALTNEWKAGKKRQQMGVSSTSPRVPLTCPSVPFPANRSSGIWHASADDRETLEIPVGKDFFLALRAAWRKEPPTAERHKIPPPTDPRDLDEDYICFAIEEPVGNVMSPPVPLSYMVSEILVPQWTVDGLFDVPTVHKGI